MSSVGNLNIISISISTRDRGLVGSLVLFFVARGVYVPVTTTSSTIISRAALGLSERYRYEHLDQLV